MPERNEITSNIDLLLDTLPSRIRELIAQAEHPQEDLLETAAGRIVFAE